MDSEILPEEYHMEFGIVSLILGIISTIFILWDFFVGGTALVRTNLHLVLLLQALGLGFGARSYFGSRNRLGLAGFVLGIFGLIIIILNILRLWISIL